MIRTISYSTPAFTQHSFEVFCSRFQGVASLYVELEYDEGLDMFDWTQVNLPCLQDLTLSCCPIKSIKFNQSNTPALESLSTSNQGPEDAAEFKLDLPHLTSLSFEFTHVKDGSGFAASLSASPKPQQFSSYKLWGIGDSQQRLHLPECTSLGLYRSDDLDWLEVDAPKLMSLNLQACYSCEHVRIFPTEGPPVEVNLVNANIGRKSLNHLLRHPRVGPERMHGNNDDDEDIGGMLGDYPAPNMAGMMGGPMAELFGNMPWGQHGGFDEADDSCEEEGEGWQGPDLAGAQMMQMLAMLQQAGYGGPPGHGAYAEEDEDEEEDDEEDEEDEDEEEDEEGEEGTEDVEEGSDDDEMDEGGESEDGSGWETVNDPAEAAELTLSNDQHQDQD